MRRKEKEANDEKEEDVEEHPNQGDSQFCVEHKDCFILPEVLAVQVDGVEDILDQRVHDNSEQNGILKAEDKLDTGSLGQS